MNNILGYDHNSDATFNPNQLEALSEMLGGGESND